jgi:hypothetical protein
MIKLPDFKPCLFLFLLSMMVASSVSAQSWMPGFNFRKRITINKVQVSGTANLLDFPVLISITDPDLIYLAAQCNTNKLASSLGLDLSFATVSAPETALKFQLDRYDPVTGTLTCWLKVPALVASGSSAASTALFLYYGSNVIQLPNAASSWATWAGFAKLWHMNLDASPAGSRSGKSDQRVDMIQGSGGMNAQSFVAGKIGYAAKLNGSTSFLNAAQDTSSTFTISGWFKISRLDLEQVLVSNDSTGFGGYTIKINATGKLTLETKKGTSSSVVSLSASTTLVPEQWYYFAVQRDGRNRSIYINGKAASAVSRPEAVGPGGHLNIGRSKQNDRYYGGLIDELRITGQVFGADWLKTEYNNQNDPASFYLLGAEEQNPTSTNTGYTFNAAVNNDWSEPGNWNQGHLPEPYANVLIKSAGVLNMTDLTAVHINKLTLEDGALLSLKRTQLFICNTDVAVNAIIRSTEQSALEINGNVRINGLLDASDASSTINLAPNQSLTNMNGHGSIRASSLRLKATGAAQVIDLAVPLSISKVLNLERGILNSNGLLTLTATASQDAAIGPISDPSLTAIVGDVQVETYVTGSFPTPSSARGWRLWSAPVYAGMSNGLPEYDLSSIKNAMFVTGKTGASNGFDTSPQNGNTIYTHDQSILGTLAQKYVPVPDMSVRVPLGKGIYVYSRGSRNAPDAFKNQVQTLPFINPEAFILRYSGNLFTGVLRVPISSRNRKEEGDGFNLLGNPYASAIRWGSLEKEHAGSFVWMYNTLNNAYEVSDNPDQKIPAGAGFFVKMLDGESIGAITFRESAKVVAIASNSQSAVMTVGTETNRPVHTVTLSQTFASAETSASTLAKELRLEATISRGVFSHAYILKLVPGGTDELTDADAPSLGDGYIAISGLVGADVKVDVDTRGLPEPELSVKLYVKGWASGDYTLDFAGFEGFNSLDSIILNDRYLNSSKLIPPTNTIYNFQINMDIPESQGANRFSLRIKKGRMTAEPSIALYEKEKQVIVYPNPFRDNIQLKTSGHFPDHMKVLIRDMMGKLLLNVIPEKIDGSSTISLNAGSLMKGMYIIELIDTTENKRLKSAKIIKL